MSETMRSCPDCKGRGANVAGPSGSALRSCGRCGGKGDIPDLGQCVGPVFDEPTGKQLCCPFRADRGLDGELLCDGHALGKALADGLPCPSCGGSPSKGMHRGEVIGHGKVMTCSSSQAQRDLSDVSSQLQASLGRSTVGLVDEEDEDPLEDICGCPLKGGDSEECGTTILKRQMPTTSAMSYCDCTCHPHEPDEDPREEALTDAERNPSMGMDDARRFE